LPLRGVNCGINQTPYWDNLPSLLGQNKSLQSEKVP
jgi:hypothetical protein